MYQVGYNNAIDDFIKKLVKLLEECKTEHNKDEFGNYVVNIDYLLEYIEKDEK